MWQPISRCLHSAFLHRLARISAFACSIPDVFGTKCRASLTIGLLVIGGTISGIVTPMVTEDLWPAPIGDAGYKKYRLTRWYVRGGHQLCRLMAVPAMISLLSVNIFSRRTITSSIRAMMCRTSTSHCYRSCLSGVSLGCEARGQHHEHPIVESEFLMGSRVHQVQEFLME
jgi:hypothetical protein